MNSSKDTLQAGAEPIGAVLQGTAQPDTALQGTPLFDPERLLATFLELVQIDSPSLHEAQVAAYCKDALEAAGCSVRFDDSRAQTGSDTGNLIATLPGTLPGKLFFSAHMDTVMPGEGIKPFIEDGIIRSEGDTVLGGDDKSGVAAILELIRVLATSDRPHPTVGILLSVGEEVSLRGAKAMDSSAFAGEPCFVLDADGKPGVVIIGAPYQDVFEAHFHGKSAHAGVRPEAGVSAIVMAARAITAMELGRLDSATTANIGTIQGGKQNNIVADSCVITGEFRSMDKQRLDEVKASIDTALQGAVAGYTEEEVGVNITWGAEYTGFMVDETDPLVQLVLGEAQTLGLAAKASYTGGGSDANIFADRGLRPVTLGTGMDAIHGPNEQLAIEDLNNLTRLICAITYAYEGQ
ncbi:MAG: M20/M25/M40 family metallo-hydrolase [Coriobacteriales bacterium]|nr:M20/M25/M40 family metallo-hydrolase [Coriobacteriales bacterium]